MSSSSPYKIPIVDLRAQYRTLKDELGQAIDAVLRSQLFILGPAVRRFEEEMAAYLRCRAAVGVASGTDALLISLMTLEIGPGDAVLVPPFTFFSSVSAITRLGATPVFIDIDPESYLMDARAVAAFLEARCHRDGDRLIVTESRLRVKAFLPVHLFGRACPMSDFLASAEPYRLAVVEDAAQACGARISLGAEAKAAGTIGDLGCFSFFPSKTLGAFGDGGLIATEREEFGEKVRMLRIHGESAKYRHQAIGVNSRLDSIQAAVLSVKRRYLDQWCDRRIERARHYQRLFRDTNLIGDRVLSIPITTDDRSHVFNNYVIRVRRRDELRRFLAQRGIQSEIYYPLPLHLQPCFAYLGYRRGDFPHAERAAAEVLALPIYPEIEPEQQQEVVRAVTDFFDR